MSICYGKSKIPNSLFKSSIAKNIIYIKMINPLVVGLLVFRICLSIILNLNQFLDLGDVKELSCRLLLVIRISLWIILNFNSRKMMKDFNLKFTKLTIPINVEGKKCVMCVTCVILTSARHDALTKCTFDNRIFMQSYFFCHETCVTLTFSNSII